MSRQTFDLNGHTLEIETDRLEVTSMLPQRDPSWRTTDDAGHEHYAVSTLAGVHYPTLYAQHGEPDEDGDCDSWWVCCRCEQKIVPGTVVDHSRRFIPGMTTYTLDGEHIPPAQAQAFIESWQRQADDRSSRRAQADREAGYL